MIPKISRYLLVAVAVITFAYVLPSIYNVLFDTRINAPYITYSTTHKEYFAALWQDGKSVFTDRHGKIYTQQQFMENTPIENYSYHLSKGTYLDSFAGMRLDPRQLQRESFFSWLELSQLNTPVYGIYPLFESQPEFGLSFSKDYFRIGKRIEFIDAKTNKLNEAKSKQFNEVLQREGFSYPAKMAAGLPTLMKKRDEGWFIVDNKDQLFHLKLIKGEPWLKKIQTPAGMQFRYIVCNDFDADEFYAIIITPDSKIYVLNKKDYSTTQLPVEGYNVNNTSAIISGTLFNKTVVARSDKGVQLTTMDRNYKVIDKYFYPLPQKSEMAIGKVASALFPFQLDLSSPHNEFISFHLSDSKNWSWLVLNLVLVIITLILIRREGKSLGRSIPDLVIVALTGIFGFLAVHIIPNKQY
ncbi:DUF4857 domain-containing protein [Pseudobacter ginsenosidimutans]|uniref:Uncharacterized protein DUF4857 n=1 Tax=Pseudobacter ginsenosidimutans TaxID=661488 RepID=A0A4Q7M7H1_9BACT|nr:DUF4857 domain-containing protein [Pseudobacter ginsenosidimutans]QEC42512.1 DUF4857 domain-containing protein [Pseudobacter ginsenosidimutans]RZS64005.1 uncharacterized protein DUF4857 [Pseudobacter ginsenosidimutans]